MFASLPKTDLNKLKQEVLLRESDAALPRNLNDTWLQLIGRDLDLYFCEAEEGVPGHSYLAGPLALVLHILLGKANQHGQIAVPFDRLEQHLKDYRLELVLELVSRKTSISATQATLTSIFENRTVEVSVRG